MISIHDLKSHAVQSILRDYTGINPYIRGLRNDVLNNKGKLTETQVKYVNQNHQREPQLINRLLTITPYLGEELQKAHELPFVPVRIKVEYMLAETDKTYHVYGKLTQKQKESKMYFLPKTQVLDDPYFENIEVDVDFTPYNNELAKINRQLYPHQEVGIKFLLGRKGAILGEDMGVAKTIQAVIAALESGAKKILIVCPSSVKINWQREIAMVSPMSKSTIVSDSWREAQFTIINFDILKNYHTPQSAIKKANDKDPIKIN